MREKLSWKEAEAVIRAYRAERGMSSDVEIDVLAVTLGTTSADVRRLARTRRRFVDRSGVLSATVALGIAGTLSLFMGSRPTGSVTVGRWSRSHHAPMPVTDNFVIVSDGMGRVHALNASDGQNTTELWSYPADERPIPHDRKL